MSLQACENDTYFPRSETNATAITRQMYDGILTSFHLLENDRLKIREIFLGGHGPGLVRSWKEARLDRIQGQSSMSTDVPLPLAPTSCTQPPYHFTIVGPRYLQATRTHRNV